jgi:putative NADPH-quinone reductase
MARRITIIQGHPDPQGNRLCHRLADIYAAGAVAAGHGVKRIEVAALDFPLLRTAEEFESGPPPADIAAAQDAIRGADHVVIVFPLWLGSLPALLKGFLEQAFRPGFAMDTKSGGWPRKLLAGRSARIIVTMGMPGFVYRWYFGAHGVRNLERNILGFAGFRPVRRSLIGMVGTLDQAHKRERWLEHIKALGREGR